RDRADDRGRRGEDEAAAHEGGPVARRGLEEAGTVSSVRGDLQEEHDVDSRPGEGERDGHAGTGELEGGFRGEARSGERVDAGRDGEERRGAGRRPGRLTERLPGTRSDEGVDAQIGCGGDAWTDGDVHAAQELSRADSDGAGEERGREIGLLE